MKILQLCSRIPYPPNNGGSIAMLALTQCLCEEGNAVFVLSVNTPKHHFELQNLPSDLLSMTQWSAMDIDTTIRFASAFINLFSSQSYHIQRFYSKEFENGLIALLQKENFDIIQMESLFVTPYISAIRKHSKAKVVYRAHNIEFKIWERMLEGMKAGIKKRYLNIQIKRLRKYEMNIINHLDAIVSITPEDKKDFQEMGCNVPIHITPIGINLDEFSLAEHHNLYPVLFHLGSMNWLPNLEAVDWFLSNVWSDVHKKYPALKLYLGGRGMPERILKSNTPGLYIFDAVQDAKKWMNEKDIMIVPLLSGSGMRVKIIEGMALGKTIISTTIGAEGISYSSLKNILIADTSEDFISMIDLCIKDYDLCKSIGNNSKELVMRNHNNKTLGKELNQFYTDLIL
jgi:glycosyltransferase involved in cell wall biosynthesis